ncbi:hypothetical protein [Sphaerospermopsis reniformis]|uniref:hypothetical protein n=1 Tax=Sphaerospermopsis reniformis TaxID=531300 RepID=UPI0010FA460C|nr:hypothetical protein [Sphaerospermopsis reniformis]
MSFSTPVVFTPMSSVMVCCFGVILPVICFFGGMLQIFLMSRRGAERGRSDDKFFSYKRQLSNINE